MRGSAEREPRSVASARPWAVSNTPPALFNALRFVARRSQLERRRAHRPSLESGGGKKAAKRSHRREEELLGCYWYADANEGAP